MEPQDILLAISLGIIVLWTTRLARSKGLNPWAWGAGAVLLIALTWQFSRPLLGVVVMAPLIFLLLFRSPLFRRNREAETQIMPCPRCGAADTGGLNFCVQCGWDLSKSYVDVGEGVQETTTTAEAPVELEPVDAADGVEEKPAAESVPEAEPVLQPTADVGVPPAPGAVAEPVLAQEADAAPVEAAPAPVAEPTPVPARPTPTAPNLTERGLELFNEGRYQEAIDQFTKAIALDPEYREAWERRAEAYGRLGRSERQKADLRRLEAI